MFYRETGQFKTNYRTDQAVFPIKQDAIGIWLLLAFMFFVVPLTFNDFWLNSIMIPTLIFALAAIGLNLLLGYAGQISLGTGGFMGVGAYSCYKLTTIFPDLNILVPIFLSGFVAAVVGVLFGIPSLRIKGFYLAIATLASQFFLVWAFGRIAWLYNYNPSGAIEVATRRIFDIPVTGPLATSVTRYVIVLSVVVVLTWVASNLVRGRVGRAWMAVRDMDIAAELIGIKLLQAKLSAFAVSSYFAGVAGALMVFMWLGAAEVESFDINHSFLILFMVVIGGSGSLIGSFMGAAFIWVLPIFLRNAPGAIGLDIGSATIEHINFMVVGGLIIFFLIVEPNGIARLWQIGKEKLRRWPFPY